MTETPQTYTIKPLVWTEPAPGTDGPIFATLAFGAKVCANVDAENGCFCWAVLNEKGELIEDLCQSGFVSYAEAKECAAWVVDNELTLRHLTPVPASATPVEIIVRERSE